MSAPLTIFLGLLCASLFLGGIRLMNSPRSAVAGNFLGTMGMLFAIILTLTGEGIISVRILWVSLAVGSVLGYVLAARVTMLRMPQLVALLNGLGGGASAGTALIVIGGGENSVSTLITAALALAVGSITLSGSLVAALKLDRKLPQKPTIFSGQTGLNLAILLASIGLIFGMPFVQKEVVPALSSMLFIATILFGILFAIRIGGADMPITISLLNSLSGLAASIAGFAVRDPLLVATGAIVGSAGLILTRIMCRAMNRSLLEILMGRTISSPSPSSGIPRITPVEETATRTASHDTPALNTDPIVRLMEAKTVIIVPGYGMALSQAQLRVKLFYDLLVKQKKDVRFAIHPVAGRMPGHMNVLLAEADIPYEKLFEMDDINPLFPDTDVVIIVGANDVVNPAASTAEGTPIYGMPILNAGEAKFIIIFNKDTRPGYAGVENPLYSRENVALFLGDAAEQIEHLTEKLISGQRQTA